MFCRMLAGSENDELPSAKIAAPDVSGSSDAFESLAIDSASLGSACVS